ncbi:extracellular solute-binding protein [Gorillibacterium sp. CAU 1737]|uniref:sugar ABC transporter substrate-binding protein n=1 Tax=Gorillibacterium sp. CAU 1737 TaxID=3140362 RepID=UPI0032617E88
MTKRKGFWILSIIVGFMLLVMLPFSGAKEKRQVKPSGTEEEGIVAQGQNDAGNAAITLHVSVSLGEAEWKSLQALNAEFLKSHNNVSVKLENLSSSERYTAWKKAGQFGTGPDVMLLDNGWVQEFAALGFLYPVSEYFTTDRQSQYLPVVLDQVKWNGYLWGVPKDIDPYILVWNRKTAEENGWKKAPSTSAELIEWNRKLLAPADGRYGIYFNPSDYMAFLSVYTAFPSEIPEGSNPFLNAKEPAVQAALKTFLLPQKEEWDPALLKANFPTPSESWDPWQLLADGKLAAMVTTVSEYRRHSLTGVELASLPMPGGAKTGTGSWLKGRSYSLSSHTVNSVIAMEWIKSVTGAEAEKKEWTETSMLPVLLSSYSSTPLMMDEKYMSYTWLVQEGRALPFTMDSAAHSQSVMRLVDELSQGKLVYEEFIKQLSNPLESPTR